MTLPFPWSKDTWSQDKAALRRQLQAERQALVDRLERAVQLQHTLRVWLVDRPDTVMAAYWPIKGEFDPLPALFRWTEGLAADERDKTLSEPEDPLSGAAFARRIVLPVALPGQDLPVFHAWWPGCEMEPDAHGIPKPKDTERLQPSVLFVPCVGYGPKGVRLGYGGGFYDRLLRRLQPRPLTVGLAYSHGFIPWLTASEQDMPLDVILTEEGIAWGP